MNEYFHSVTLDKDLCKGCTNCLKHCPTEAIRIRNGKAKIINERCIDCGECIRICPYHAKKAITDDYEKIFDYKYKIALPAPAFYAQYNDVNIEVLLYALELLGFDEVREVTIGADAVSKKTDELLSGNLADKPLISSSCPAIVRLIRIRFPSLIPNILPLQSPMDIVAKKAKFVKGFNILANVGISSFLLAGVLPKTQYLFNKAVTGSYLDPGLRKS